MLIKDFKNLPIALALTTGAGILMHDTQIDHATSLGMNGNYSSFNSSTAGRLYKKNDHLHYERPIYETNSNNRAQSRLNEDKKYAVNKRLVGSNNDFDYIWPSV